MNSAGNSPLKGSATVKKRGEQPFYPVPLLRLLICISAVTAVVALVAALFPLPLDRIADPLAEPGSAVAIPWILKPAVLLRNLLSSPGLTIVAMAILAVLFVLLPVVDRGGGDSLKGRAAVAIPFLIWMLFLLVSLLLPARMPW